MYVYAPQFFFTTPPVKISLIELLLGQGHTSRVLEKELSRWFAHQNQLSGYDHWDMKTRYGALERNAIFIRWNGNHTLMSSPTIQRKSYKAGISNQQSKTSTIRC